ncbi:hypothetical protein TNCT_136801 [Trichonephila clavata]|uniref:Uncharacterized protein n=1 Tax=Trichonephila clavata TaxID=2740835 RepID=A0A8X6H2K6_TRICU|nr:hypothetical protein TNCT_136801 [Trichonephila clavata]
MKGNYYILQIFVFKTVQETTTKGKNIFEIDEGYVVLSDDAWLMDLASVVGRDDNASCHVARFTMDWYNDNGGEPSGPACPESRLEFYGKPLG